MTISNDKKRRICIWYTFPSPHISCFVDVLSSNPMIDIQVRYALKISNVRLQEGWSDDNALQPYEQFVHECLTPQDMLKTLDDWRSYIHIISSSSFYPMLIKYLIKENAVWMEWSEVAGINLANTLNCNPVIYNLVKPLYYKLKGATIGKKLKQNASGIYSQGKLSRDYFRSMGIDNDKIKDLYYTVETVKKCEPDQQIQKLASGRNVLLYVGSLSSRKGIDVLIKAFHKNSNKNWCLILCGKDNSDGKYIKLIQKYGMQDSIFLLGAYSIEKMSSVYNAAQVFVLPSRFDGWGAVLNEAASIGLPLISTDMTGAAWHLIKHGETGFRVKAGRANELAQAINEYVKNSSLIKTHGDKTKALYMEHYTPEKNADRLITSLYELGY